MQTTPNEPARDALSALRIDRTAQHAAPSQGWSRVAKFSVLLAVFAAAVYLLVSRFGLVSKGGAPLGNWIAVPDVLKQRPEVRVIRAIVESGQSADATVVATGYLESRRQAKIGARAPGRIQSVAVEEGTRVKKDDVLAVLEHADLDASLAATQANVVRARAAVDEQQVLIDQKKREYDRASNLHATKSISDAEHDEFKFQYDSAVARLKSMNADVQLAEARFREAQQVKENMHIRAPFDGTVISKDAEVGESILPGGMGEASGRGSAVTIADLDNLEVECDVKEDYISRVFPGQRTEVAVDAVSDRRYRGQVRKIIPMGDRARATIKVKVTIADADSRLFPEMSSTVYFLPADSPASESIGNSPRVFCAAEAIKSDAESEFVWVIDDEERTKKTRVQSGKRTDNRIEIVSGLTGHELVVASSVELTEGQLVKISE